MSTVPRPRARLQRAEKDGIKKVMSNLRFGGKKLEIRDTAEYVWGYLYGEPVIGFRWVPKKGLDLLRAACAELGVEPELVGAEGPRAFSEVRAALHRACLFALPCREAPDGDRDGIPVALMEAMSAGLPVLTTSLEGISELVDETVGWVVPPEDPSALAEALREALSCPEERLRRGRAARERVRAHWSLDAQVEGLLEAWA